jgi:hypothetical protein
MKCGHEFFVRDINGANLVRWVWMCRDDDDRTGSWLGLAMGIAAYPIDHPLQIHNGEIRMWQGVLGYLALVAKHSTGPYAYEVVGDWYFRLGKVMRISDLVRVLGRAPEEIRAELTDLVITVEE